jgi:hypothetical protein
MMQPAALRRQMAIGMIVELYMPSHNPSSFPYNFCENREATPDEISENILKLRGLGKTARWQNSVSLWNRLVQDAKSDGSHIPTRLRWGFLQGLVSVSNANVYRVPGPGRVPCYPLG